MKRSLTLLLLLIPLLHFAQRKVEKNILPEDFCVSAEEVHLYRLINEYRLVLDQEIIPLSKSLSYVAHVHVRDLFQHRPDLRSCNLHSWSDKGSWTPCCYARDPNRTGCMWNKPRELTNYMGNGQELILWENIPATSGSAFEQWRNYELTNDMILSRGRWADKNWKAIGVSIYEGYASLWFGEVDDHETTFLLCDSGDELAAGWLAIELAEKFEEPEEIIPEEIPQIRYYLIVSSFKEESQATKEVNRLHKGGYTDARMLLIEGNFRVSVYDYSELSEAQKMRRQLSAVFKGIWIMEK